MIIEGAIAVKSAITNQKRKINCIYLDKDKKSKDFNYIRFLCHDRNIEFKNIERLEIEKIASGKSHGGVIADVEYRNFQSFDYISKSDVIFYIDGIEDPFNLGYVFRTLYAFGFKDIIVPNRDFGQFEATLLKSSAGAFDYLNIYQSKDFLNEIKTLKNSGYKTCALYRSDDAIDIFKSEHKSKAIYLLGGEKRGISSHILNEVDELLYIPYGNDYKMALSAASAIDVLATLVYQSRRYQ